MVLRYARLFDHCHGIYVSRGERILVEVCLLQGPGPLLKWNLKGLNSWALDAFEKREAYLAYESDYLIHIKVCFVTHQGMYEYLVVYNPALRLERRASSISLDLSTSFAHRD
jgi:hypothetical protein